MPESPTICEVTKNAPRFTATIHKLRLRLDTLYILVSSPRYVCQEPISIQQSVASESDP